MGRKNGDGGGEGRTAGGRLQALRDQIAALTRRKTELGALTGQPDAGNPEAWVEAAATAAGEAAAIERILPALEAEAKAAEEQLKAAREAETLAAVKQAQAGLESRLSAVIAATATLEAALGELAQQERVIQGLGGWLPPTYEGILGSALANFKGCMRRAWPHLVGLPQKPTHREEVLAVAAHDVRVAEEQLEKLRAAKPTYTEIDRRSAADEAELRAIDRANTANWSAVQSLVPAWQRRVDELQAEVMRRKQLLLELEDPSAGGSQEQDFTKRALQFARKANLRLEDAADELRRRDAQERREREKAAESAYAERGLKLIG